MTTGHVLRLADDTLLLRVAFGEAPTAPLELGARCDECGAWRGHRHSLGCRAERCPRHTTPLMSCGCLSPAAVTPSSPPTESPGEEDASPVTAHTGEPAATDPLTAESGNVAAGDPASGAGYEPSDWRESEAVQALTYAEALVEDLEGRLADLG